MRCYGASRFTRRRLDMWRNPVWSRNSAALSERACYGLKAPRRGTWCPGLRIYSDPWKAWRCAWPGRIPAGATIASSERSRIWAPPWRIKRSAISSTATASRLPRSASTQQPGKTLIRAHLEVLAGTDFFTVEVVTLRGRHLLRLILYPPGESQGRVGRGDTSSERGVVDEADRSKRNHGRMGIPREPSVFAS